MPKAQPSAPPERVAQYDALIAAFPDVERKGATMPYTSANGNMFSFLMPSGAMALRLSEEDRSAFRGTYGGKPVVQHGAVLAEYVEVPPSLLAKPAELRRFFAKSVAYARTLEPKATKRTPSRTRSRSAPKRTPTTKRSNKKKAAGSKKAAKKRT